MKIRLICPKIINLSEGKTIFADKTISDSGENVHLPSVLNTVMLSNK